MLDTAQTTTRRRRMAMMDESGHMTWSWDEENNDQIIPAIRRLMERGYVFWIVRRDPLREDELEIEEIGELRDNRNIVVKNEDFAELLAAGVLRPSRDDRADLHMGRRATTPEEAASNDTVAHRPLRGG